MYFVSDFNNLDNKFNIDRNIFKHYEVIILNLIIYHEYYQCRKSDFFDKKIALNSYILSL